jgi:DNA mismatch repair protein MutL
MDREDANRSIIRHATSKIRSSDDLFNINSLGFRGEALASIAAVSQLSIITKVDGALEGYNLVCEGGLVVSSGPIASDVGTTIEVNNLFFNTPVRKKFLKTDAVELRHIIDIVTNYALLNPQIAIKLNHENHNLIQTPAIAAMRENVAAIYGYAIAKDLLEVDFEKEGVKVSGLISKPYDVRNDTKQQVLFVNDRWIKNSKLSKAIYDGYHSMLFTQKHPVFVLHIKIDPTRVDVNVHPQKHEIKIEQEDLVLDVVSKAVNLTLENNNLIPMVDVDFNNDMMGVVQSKYNFEKSKQKTLEVSESSSVSYGSVDVLPQVEMPSMVGSVMYGGVDSDIGDFGDTSGSSVANGSSVSQNEELEVNCLRCKYLVRFIRLFFLLKWMGRLLLLISMLLMRELCMRNL